MKMADFEVILMCGIPGSGKTTFCRERLFPQYLYISLDRLRTRSAEAELFAFALRRRKSCVIDNTNISRQERARYIPAAKKAGARVVTYWFEPDVGACLARNAGRTGRERVPDIVMERIEMGYGATYQNRLPYGLAPLYTAPNGREIEIDRAWLCPVTLLVLFQYPKKINLYIPENA